MGLKFPPNVGEASLFLHKKHHMCWGALVPRLLLWGPHPEAGESSVTGKPPFLHAAPRLRQGEAQLSALGPTWLVCRKNGRAGKLALGVRGSLSAPSPGGRLNPANRI